VCDAQGASPIVLLERCISRKLEIVTQAVALRAIGGETAA
jgi:hypothetical protein